MSDPQSLLIPFIILSTSSVVREGLPRQSRSRTAHQHEHQVSSTRAARSGTLIGYETVLFQDFVGDSKLRGPGLVSLCRPTPEVESYSCISEAKQRQSGTVIGTGGRWGQGRRVSCVRHTQGSFPHGSRVGVILCCVVSRTRFILIPSPY
ncbi:hypothetical protein RRG08_060180 [Elysia crispata]|uniref:Uncharacterized protein n=1 Tax=Elysia crispata TaxID=231223 RepID=A0AAE0ZYY8_9GAST|nr:hypothetical protein RRG08_060180 [Elysia crispata]